MTDKPLPVTADDLTSRAAVAYENVREASTTEEAIFFIEDALRELLHDIVVGARKGGRRTHDNDNNLTI